MFKVIVERPRRPNITRADNQKFRIIGDAENLPKQESISKKYGIYWGERLNENLAPLRRFLISRIGRPWSDVWSEICKGLSPDSAVKKHVRDHAIQYVETNIRMVDGAPYYLGRYSSSGWRPLTGTANYPQLYVDPDTGLLQKAPEEESYRSKQRKKRRLNSLNRCEDGSHNEFIDGIWYNVKTETVVVYEKRFRYGYNKETKQYQALKDETGKYLFDMVPKKETKTTYTQLNKKYLKKFFKWQKTGTWGGKRTKKARFFRKSF